MVLLGFRQKKQVHFKEKSSKQELGNFVVAIQCGGMIYSIDTFMIQELLGE